MKPIEIQIQCETPEEAICHLKALDLYAAVWDALEELRQHWKYGEKHVEVYHEIYQMLHRVLEEHGINISEEFS